MSVARAAAWGLVVAMVPTLDALTAGRPPVLRMLALISGLFLAMKAVVCVEAARTGVRLSASRWLAFTLLWPGMRPALFVERRARLDARPLLMRGLVRFGLGAILLVSARVAWRASASQLLTALLLLPGLSLMLHFGIFNLAAGLWRLRGIDCEALFRAPLAARGLREFWSRRWNLAFSEMTSLAVYRPIVGALGPRAGLLAAFIVSGLFHEVAISLPVNTGFGRPLLYFVLQGLLVSLERPQGFGRAATLFCLAAPLPLLFHSAFLRGVLWTLVE
jgi:alginate O-acetyltransferase complex protein AlgI